MDLVHVIVYYPGKGVSLLFTNRVLYEVCSYTKPTPGRSCVVKYKHFSNALQSFMNDA